ncbi:hypothetical protein E2C01_085192 [Portunus trituberculatus]|uniref:Chitin-binding type-2 domain-containing protein n=1 Tax=Portunus trituberculatus TaxID=210409 RepID=A0A5B7JB93_PORTR|nr:hypothetical protein [Portunus trituberculatus]
MGGVSSDTSWGWSSLGLISSDKWGRFLFSCPPGYLYDNQLKRCEKETIIGPCDRLSDAVVQTHVITPVVEIKPEKLDQFFESDIYWDLMPFLPNEPQKLVPILPSSFSRAPDREVRPFA